MLKQTDAKPPTILPTEDSEYIRRRRRQLAAWPVAGGGALFVLLVLYAWVSIMHPQYANPMYVYQALAAGELNAEAMAALALLAPILLTVLFAAAGFMLTAVFSFMRREKRLLDIIDRAVNNMM